jgi:YjbR
MSDTDCDERTGRVMTDYTDVPATILSHVRSACAHLPEAYEETAFAGTRWRIRTRTLAHVVTIDGVPEPVTVVWFHAAPEELHALVATGQPFSPGWDDGLVTMELRDDGSTDWAEVKELLTESYCLLAPKKLIALLGEHRPTDET